jgi:hypothetical protein
MSLDAIVLLGWLTEKEAIDFLQKDCANPLSEEDARKIWRGYRDKVEALPERAALAPRKYPLTRDEGRFAERFLAFLYKMRVRDVREVIKIELDDLVVHQRVAYTGKIEEYVPKINTAKGWNRECLPTHPVTSAIRIESKRDGMKTTGISRLPHGEFFFLMDDQTGQWSIIEGSKHVSVVEFDKRMTLYAGYHRSIARLQSAIPEATDRPVLIALTSATLFSSQSTVEGEAAVREMRGLRPPLLRDFLDESLFMRVKLLRKRYEMQIKGEVVPIPDP